MSGQLHASAALPPSTNWIRGWMGVGTVLDAVEKTNVLVYIPCLGSNTNSSGVQPFLIPTELSRLPNDNI
jgi:hypothetical protein